MHGRIRGRLVKPWKFQLEKIISMCKYLHMERDSKKIVRRLLDEDFELISVVGSHHKFRKGAITVIVPHPKKDLPTGTARAIAKQAGWI
jgi:predicted RNA binding protein YcfA (HicA-like mRNA interferase family)